VKALLPALLVAVTLSPVTLSAQLPEYRALRSVDAITVDGDLEEFSWSAALRMGPFVNIRNPADASLTQAAIVWDDRNLYAAFISVDREPWSTMLERDTHLWEQEVVEIFLDPDGDGKNYAELEISPNNVIVDLLIPAPRAIEADVAARWDIAGLRTAATRRTGGWTVEIAIPWASLEATGVSRPPKPGDRWRVGMYRIERPAGRSGGPDAPVELLAWSPTERSFHEPERFGWVEFALPRP
jgi:hypothetical protein